MKRIILIAGIVSMSATATFAHNSIDLKGNKEARAEKGKDRKESRQERRAENRNEPSISTRNQLAIDFPDAENIRFDRTKNFEKVFFSLGNREMTAYYDYDDELVGTSEEKAFTDLPENAQKGILKDFADYTIGSVIKYDDNENNDYNLNLSGTVFDATNYFVELDKAGKGIVVKVDLSGSVSFFSDMK